MPGKCKLPECPAPELKCHLGHEDVSACENFLIEVIEKKEKKEKNASDKKSDVSWTGNAFSVSELSTVSHRTSPVLIGIVGRADAGKTSFLGMLYTLLLGGKSFNGYNFSGTKTILGWDELYHNLKIRRGNVAFPQPTPVSANRIYHVALRDSERRLKDVLFADASGEVFSSWAVNRDDETADNARWIYANSSAFLLFIDCEALCTGKNSAKMEIMLIARQFTHNLRNRPVLAVWSKADKKNDILDSLRTSIKSELEDLFDNFFEIDVSNYLEPGPDDLVHVNNLRAVDWILEKVSIPSDPDLSLDEIKSDDPFFNYKIK